MFYWFVVDCLSLSLSPLRFSFLRKGRVGTYAEEMPAEFIEKFDAAASLERPELKAYLVAEVITEQESGEDDRHVST